MSKYHRARLLLADDKDEYRKSLKTLLELQSYSVEEASSPAQALDLLEHGNFDLVLADMRMLGEEPLDLSGFELAQAATDQGVPCIIITAFESVDAVLLALRRRTDQPPLAVDFVLKKHGPRAVLDAVALNITQNQASAEQTSAEMAGRAQQPATSEPVKSLAVDPQQRRAWKSGREVELSDLQYKLLECLCRSADRVSSHKELIKAVYGQDVSEREATEDKRLERLIWRLREKIEEDPHNPRHLLSVPGRGFRLLLE